MNHPERILSPDFTDDDVLEGSVRPQRLGEFIGQDHLKDNLRIFIEAARNRGDAIDHVLLYGPPGLGKTTLAQIMANELGVGFRSTLGPVISKVGDLAALLTNLQPRDILFIDEIHRMPPAVEEILYPAIEDFKLDIMIGEGPTARAVRIDLPPFTLVGATTRAGLITRPLRERFGIPLQLNFYTPTELRTIVMRLGSLLGVGMDESGAEVIAARSRGTPRIAGRLVRRIRDMAQVEGQPIVDRAYGELALNRLEIDARGLDRMDRRYLKIMIDFYGGGPVGVETLAAALGEQKDILEDVVEPYLIQQGLIQRTPRGRMLSAEGQSYIQDWV